MKPPAPPAPPREHHQIELILKRRLITAASGREENRVKTPKEYIELLERIYGDKNLVLPHIGDLMHEALEETFAKVIEGRSKGGKKRSQ